MKEAYRLTPPEVYEELKKIKTFIAEGKNVNAIESLSYLKDNPAVLDFEKEINHLLSRYSNLDNINKEEKYPDYLIELNKINKGMLDLIQAISKSMNVNDSVFEYFELKDSNSRDYFFDRLSQTYETASEIILSGRGFTKANNEYFPLLFKSTEKALKNGARITRIQTTNDTVGNWMEKYNELKNNPSYQFQLIHDPSNKELVNIAVIDAENSNKSIVQFLIENKEESEVDGHYESSVAFFIHKQTFLATSLKKILNRRIKSIKTTPNIFYFAYGSNMRKKQMDKRCKRIIDEGIPAILYDYELVFNVKARQYSNNRVAGIIEKENSEVLGVLYKLTPKEFEDLKSDEHPGYKPFKKKVHRIDEGQRKEEAIVFIPSKDRVSTANKISLKYLRYVIEGAIENGFKELEKELMKLKKEAS